MHTQSNTWVCGSTYWYSLCVQVICCPKRPCLMHSMVPGAWMRVICCPAGCGKLDAMCHPLISCMVDYLPRLSRCMNAWMSTIHVLCVASNMLCVCVLYIYVCAMQVVLHDKVYVSCGTEPRYVKHTSRNVSWVGRSELGALLYTYICRHICRLKAGRMCLLITHPFQ